MPSTDAAEEASLSISNKDANVLTATDEQVENNGTRVTTVITTMKQTHDQGESTVKQKDTKTVEAETEIEETIYDCLCCCPCLRRFEKDARAKMSDGNNPEDKQKTST